MSLSTIIRMLWTNVSIPPKYAETAGSVDLTIALMVGKLQGKMFSGLIPDCKLYHSVSSRNCSQKCWKGLTLYLFSVLNRSVVSV
jgi:hypothetical protein